MDRSALRDAIARELETNLLPFWREKSLDHRHGGFIAEMANDGTVRDDAPRGLILNARLLWTFSALFRELGDARDLALARRAFDVLEGRFRDREHGGYVWRVDADGRPLDTSKKTYGQAFAIYALSEHFRATSDTAASTRRTSSSSSSTVTPATAASAAGSRPAPPTGPRPPTCGSRTRTWTLPSR